MQQKKPPPYKDSGDVEKTISGGRDADRGHEPCPARDGGRGADGVAQQRGGRDDAAGQHDAGRDAHGACGGDVHHGNEPAVGKANTHAQAADKARTQGVRDSR